MIHSVVTSAIGSIATESARGSGGKVGMISSSIVCSGGGELCGNVSTC